MFTHSAHTHTQLSFLFPTITQTVSILHVYSESQLSMNWDFDFVLWHIKALPRCPMAVEILNCHLEVAGSSRRATGGIKVPQDTNGKWQSRSDHTDTNRHAQAMVSKHNRLPPPSHPSWPSPFISISMVWSHQQRGCCGTLTPSELTIGSH